MKTILPALALMLSAVSFTGCDSNYDGAVEAEEALIDDEDAESALETEFDLANAGSPTRAQTCAQWTPPPGLCKKADILCLDPEITPGPCATLTQCIKCSVDWSGEV
ncbi:hypothetical protein OV203_13480 [Nannocystis sp. ILAH1]|uniref:hypothetical protein n=1 Tax=Nannocystis sp. ILAH1 TaxID=2996789 RepID=UPI00226D837F|nr:hypothetical protein [Nannocystis sp. ILAH1]MCY0988144.1 hypothetical protein [Nannocystis sp. ILAH1]